ncbi:hypothetical protein PH210_06020 [Paenibacillus sp. BSR1-1]|uniref:hypothetical protein n=1 Tax=Paenibacillus sp. BSR1-1 TaxID=3020845 RepID=UPI0025B0CF90|nr:hypothetical protein [Paenibacillus sp. BSR1-1]MDN3015762.1 hypothetical protein [Paenibacillus sp. BSR1-1]
MFNERYERVRANQRDCNCDLPLQTAACCSGSNLRTPGIKRTSTPGVYFADADLQCSTIFCTGSDSDIIYDWSIIPSLGNARIVGDRRKVGDNRVEIEGSGTFWLTVQVTFRCQVNVPPFPFASCLVETTVKFNQ